MKNLIVKKCNTTAPLSREEISHRLESVPWNDIDTVNWPEEYDYRPSVQFRIGYGDSEFLLQYRVTEKHVRAVATADNGEVWKDSCVEFFISPAADGIYYNFEFNCIGVCLLATGLSRVGREAAPLDIVGKTSRFPSLNKTDLRDREGNVTWDISLVIPYACFYKHPGFSPEGKTVRANFYKCGDNLPEPHFLSWNPIKTDKPDFHRPEFFGQVTFE